MAKTRKLKFDKDAPRCGRSSWFAWSLGSRSSASGWQDDRYSCHKSDTAAERAFQKRCKPGSIGFVGKGRSKGSPIRCER